MPEWKRRNKMVEDPGSNLPQATVVPKKRTRVSIVWLIPILAAVVAVGIAVQRIMNEGPTISIVFQEAQGLEAGKTFIKYKDVDIGEVTSVQLSPDYRRVEVTAKIAKSAAGLMVDDAKFWVVKPRVTLSGISGLGTLLSGNYIGFEEGSSTTRATQFTGIEIPPIMIGSHPGRQFVLKADSLGSLGTGSPILYRHFEAGRVITYSLDKDGKAVTVKIFVDSPYDKYVSESTRFWNASGIDVSIGAGGVDVRTQSLVALLAGGIAFDTPTFAIKTEAAPANTIFTLYKDGTTAMKQPETVGARYVIYVTESLRGLSVGAPVTLLGLTAGEVTSVGLDLDPAATNIRGRIEIVTYPERLVGRLAQQQEASGEAIARSQEQRRALFQALIEKRNLRAQLQSGSLLTGQLYVAFEFFPDAEPAKIDWSQEVPELPAVPSTLPDIEAKLTSIVAKLEKLPFDTIGNDVAKMLGTANEMLQSTNKVMSRLDTDVAPELRGTVDELRRVLTTVDEMLKGNVNKTLAELSKTLEDLHPPLAAVDQMLKKADGAFLDKSAPAQVGLVNALQEISRAARALGVLADYLERHPESLIRGKDNP
jgi:paraquat-inducible protein B